MYNYDYSTDMIYDRGCAFGCSMNVFLILEYMSMIQNDVNTIFLLISARCERSLLSGSAGMLFGEKD